MPDPTPIRVMIVDDHPMVRDGLKLFLSVSPGFECVGEANSGEEALTLCAQARPDVVLMDMVLPGMDGVATTEAIRKQYPETRILVLSSFAEKDQVQRVLRAGATSYLLKNAGIAEMAEAIRAAHAGRSTLAPEATQALIQATTDGADNFGLTERELEVLSLLAQGHTNTEIAHGLSISESTARFHVSNVLGKLGVSNRTEAVRLALERRLIA